MYVTQKLLESKNFSNRNGHQEQNEVVQVGKAKFFRETFKVERKRVSEEENEGIMVIFGLLPIVLEESRQLDINTQCKNAS